MTSPSLKVDNPLKAALKPLASLRLTVALLALLMLLVFVGTSVQKNIDVWEVQKRFFHSWFVWVELRLFFPLWQWGFENIKGVVPMPGGYTLMGLLLLNLLAAHTVRFKVNRKRVGVLLIHAGLIVLILGEVVRSAWAEERQMIIDEGQTINWVYDTQKPELAVIDPSPADHDKVVAIPGSKLQAGATITHESLPFTIKVEKFYRNTGILGPMQTRTLPPSQRATAGAGTTTGIEEVPPFTGVDPMNVNQPGALVAIESGGQLLGRYVLSTFPASEQDPQFGLGAIDLPQEVTVGDKTYLLHLRFARDYKPYSLTLIDFAFDRYPGTNVPKNFSSRVRLVDPTRNEDREAKIWMNHPLRYAGETFFQSSFRPDEQTTILQVVDNPGWLMPYISCTVISLGLLVHFSGTLIGFLRRMSAPSAPPARAEPKPAKYVLKPQGAGLMWPLIATGVCVLFLLSAGRPPKHGTPFDLHAFGRVPIMYEGRIMPFDSMARVSLRIISGKSDLRLESGEKLPAIRWLADVLARPDYARNYKVFRIDDPALVSTLGVKSDEKMFSFNDLSPKFAEISAQFQRAQSTPKESRTAFQTHLIDLVRKINVVTNLEQGSELRLAPAPDGSDNWLTVEEAGRASGFTGGSTGGDLDPKRMNPGFAAYLAMLGSYNKNNTADFNASAYKYLDYFADAQPKVARKVKAEVLFNYFEPFYNGILLYAIGFLLVCASWLVAPMRATLRRSALFVVVFTFIVHTLGLIGRIYIQGRPPVTNLYSSAVFIGWAATLFAIGVEFVFKHGIGTAAACLIAFPSLIIAHYLAQSGDTMQMMQAVLDTNIWLATHVPVVAMGYAATFLAGTLACGAILMAALGVLNAEWKRAMGLMVYGIVCFAMLFSFVGTVLGGIWADQSWGRFWGWDPKENGAVMIVLWNAIVLHARWAGLIRERGLFTLAVVGNVVTAWSWFGTNLMGVGFHSYGFMSSGVFWLSLYGATQLMFIGLGLLPFRAWDSAATVSPRAKRGSTAVAAT